MNYSGKGLPTGRRGDVLLPAGEPVGRPDDGTVRSRIAARSMRGIELVPVLDVRCFLAHQKYVTAFHGKGETIITESLRDLEAEFADAFLRVHRNALVSVGFIEGFERAAPRRHRLRLAGRRLARSGESAACADGASPHRSLGWIHKAWRMMTYG